MNAKKCDICGAFYMPYNNKSDDNEPNGFRFLRDDGGYKLHILDVYECCPNCMNKICAFVESLKVHTEVIKNLREAACTISEYDLNGGCSSLAKAGITLGKD